MAPDTEKCDFQFISYIRDIRDIRIKWSAKEINFKQLDFKNIHVS